MRGSVSGVLIVCCLKVKRQLFFFFPRSPHPLLQRFPEIHRTIYFSCFTGNLLLWNTPWETQWVCHGVHYLPCCCGRGRRQCVRFRSISVISKQNKSVSLDFCVCFSFWRDGTSLLASHAGSRQCPFYFFLLCWVLITSSILLLLYSGLSAYSALSSSP